MGTGGPGGAGCVELAGRVSIWGGRGETGRAGLGVGTGRAGPATEGTLSPLCFAFSVSLRPGWRSGNSILDRYIVILGAAHCFEVDGGDFGAGLGHQHLLREGSEWRWIRRKLTAGDHPDLSPRAQDVLARSMKVKRKVWVVLPLRRIGADRRGFLGVGFCHQFRPKCICSKETPPFDTERNF